MDLKRITALIDLLATTPLAELEVQDASGRVRLIKRTMAPAPEGSEREVEAVPKAEAEPEAASEGIILSPMSGIFYRAAAPDEPPIVTEGDMVESGQTLALIEAMKTLCKIPAERAGRIRRILVANGDPVAEGEPLFEIE
jgi:acetyl-CoA carboxylase biotin carboxyl carrier protein